MSFALHCRSRSVASCCAAAVAAQRPRRTAADDAPHPPSADQEPDQSTSRATRCRTAARSRGRSTQMPPTSTTTSSTAPSTTPPTIMARADARRPSTTDAAGTPHLEPRLPRVGADADVTEPKQVVTYKINPKAIWYDGTPITWEDFFWQWKANNGTDKAYQISSANGYEDIESVQQGQGRSRGHRHLQAQVRGLAGHLLSVLPGLDQQEPEDLQRRLEGRSRSPPPGRSGSTAIDHTSKTITLVRNEKWWGNRAKLDSHRLPGDRPRRADRRAGQRRDRRDGRRTRRQQVQRARQAIDDRRGPRRRRPEFPPPDDQRHRPDPAGRQSASGAGDGHRPDGDRAGRCSARSASIRSRSTTTSSWPIRPAIRTTPATSASTTRPRPRQLLDEAGWKLEGNVRMKDGKPLEITCMIPAGVATSTQESELIQNMLAQVGVTLKINTVPTPDFFAKYITPGPVRLHGLLVDRHAVPDQLVEVDLRQADDAMPRASWTSSRTMRASGPTRSTSSSSRPSRSSIAPRRSRSPTTSTR